MALRADYELIVGSAGGLMGCHRLLSVTHLSAGLRVRLKVTSQVHQRRPDRVLPGHEKMPENTRFIGVSVGRLLELDALSHVFS